MIHVFALRQAVELYDFYSSKVIECDRAVNHRCREVVDRPWSLLPTARCPRWQSKSGHRDGSQNCRHSLQLAPLRRCLRRPRCRLLRGAVPSTNARQSAPPSPVARIPARGDRTGLRLSFLGKRTILDGAGRTHDCPRFVTSLTVRAPGIPHARGYARRSENVLCLHSIFSRPCSWAIRTTRP